MITKELEVLLKLAFEEAQRRRHEFVCIEHLLFALLQDREASHTILNCGGDLNQLKKDLEEFFETHLETPSPKKFPLGTRTLFGDGIPNRKKVPRWKKA